MSGSPEREYVAHGIAEDIITALSRCPWLLVIGRNSSFTYKGGAVDLKQVGHELGARYVLEGSVQSAGERLRITTQLVDTETGAHIWANRYDRDFADIFAVQDEITESVTIAIPPAVADAEQRRAMRKPTESIDAWSAFQRGIWHLHKFKPGRQRPRAIIFSTGHRSRPDLCCRMLRSCLGSHSGRHRVSNI
jgi:adenylate cyclase